MESWCCLCNGGLPHIIHRLSPTFNPRDPLCAKALEDVPKQHLYDFMKSQVLCCFDQTVTQPNSGPDDPLWTRLMKERITKDAFITGLFLDLFIQAGLDAAVLPQTVSHVCHALGFEKLGIIGTAALGYQNLLRESSVWNEKNRSLSADNTQQNDWLIQDDIALIYEYLRTVADQHFSNDDKVIEKLAVAPKAREFFGGRLKKLQQRPYISNAQIIRLAVFICTRLRDIRSQTGEILEVEGAADTWDTSVRSNIDKVVQTYATLPVTLAPFEPRNIRDHQQVSCFVFNLKNARSAKQLSQVYEDFGKIESWLSYFALGSFERGDPKSRNRLARQFLGEDELPLNVPSQDLKRRVIEVLKRASQV